MKRTKKTPQDIVAQDFQNLFNTTFSELFWIVR